MATPSKKSDSLPSPAAMNCQYLHTKDWGPETTSPICTRILARSICAGNHRCCEFIVHWPRSVQRTASYSNPPILQPCYSLCFLAPIFLLPELCMLGVEDIPFRAEHLISYLQYFDQLEVSGLTVAQCKRRPLWSRLRGQDCGYKHKNCN